MPLSAGTRLGQYVIEASLGAGGMGEVYRAHDQRLGRDVALKVLPGQVARDPERLARFEREARAVAALNHPNIVTLFSVEHAADTHFLTMELVEGEPLGQLIPRQGCPIDQVLTIGGALADALAAAHDKGIVHRDLKPANVMLTTDGRLKVLDFGLAKEMRESHRTDATIDGGRTYAGRNGDGHACVHVARTARRPAARPPQRHLLARHPAVPAVERRTAVRGLDIDRAGVGHPARHPAIPRRGPGRCAGGSRAPHPPLPREGPAAAYEAYLRARHHLAKVTPESMEQARRCYESAIALDPAFGLAQVGIGFYWLGVTIFGGCPTHEAVPAARAAVERALQTDPSIPEAHALLGFLAGLHDMDWTAAERHFEFPMARLAGFALTRPLYGGLQFFRGHYHAAIEMAERAIEEDPLEVWPRMNLHAYLQAVGRDREASEQAMKVLELDPNLVVARVSIAHFHADWGQLPEAVAAARQAYASGPWYPDAVATLAALLRMSGEEAESRALYDSLGASGRAADVRARAVYHLLCGEIDQAADFAEKAIALRDT